ncbi:MAG: Gfo/Idh/MocA family oxidoreductase [Opitutaceae bacterium]
MSAHSAKRFHLSRRTFLKRCAAVAAATGLPLWFVERRLAAAEQPKKMRSLNDRPGIALIGCGGMGRVDAGLASAFGDIVAVCDVDGAHLAEAAGQFATNGKAPARFSDFRRVLERDDVHAIINATPDHWHTLINHAAARAHKEVYAEKPLTLTIDEGRHLIKAVRENAIVLQTGSQQRSHETFRLACELVRNGRIGRLEQINVWLPAGLREGPFSSAPVPAGLDWDFWQGQAPRVDYMPQRCHVTFRYWHDYSGGTMTDWGAHHNDIVSWATGLAAPREIEPERLSDPIPGGYSACADYAVKYTCQRNRAERAQHAGRGYIRRSRESRRTAQRHSFRGQRWMDLGEYYRRQRRTQRVPSGSFLRTLRDLL